ncbi:unnamed protein product, partial [Anisakis simplex]|uniref:MAM domain-containing protein n=1 Tax=Anisakis simplex TaxID=6269 RepID=A0A0M3JAA6_ANISI
MKQYYSRILAFTCIISISHESFRYGIYQSERYERLTSQVRHAIISGLMPNTEYEIAVKLVMPNGAESAWSIHEVVRTLSKAPLLVWPEKFDERCHFEESSICGFVSDENAPLQWTRSQAASSAQM